MSGAPDARCAADDEGRPVDPALARWLEAALDDPGPFTLTPLGGGNSNETLLLETPLARRVLRRPPAAAVDPAAHSMAREHRVLGALAEVGVAAPRPLALCEDRSVAPAGFLVMECVEGVSITDSLPPAFPPGADTVRAIGEALVDALVALHGADPYAAGMVDLGRPEGFLERQVPRWRAQYDRHRVRELPDVERVATWLEANRPEPIAPTIIHSDFHLDNVLLRPDPPVSVAAIIDWEMATIGDPMLDVGLLLGLWGTERPVVPALRKLQGVTRVPGAPSRHVLAERYAAASGRSVEHLGWYMALALWKLGAIIEGAYAQHVAGRLDTPYARRLEQDVPRLFAEAAALAGLPD